MQRIELAGKVFGRLTVQEYVSNNKWKCLCNCGKSKIVASIALRRGLTKSCGCYRNEVSGNRARTHGMSRTPTYETWCKMVKRCTDPKADQYKWYGAEGITVCKRWLSFENFFADMGERPIGKTLDRINNKKGYTKANCRWATPSEQASNTRRSVRFEGKTIQEWSDELGIKYDTLSYRLRKHGTVFLKG